MTEQFVLVAAGLHGGCFGGYLRVKQAARLSRKLHGRLALLDIAVEKGRRQSSVYV